MSNDFINGSFEFIGGLLYIINIIKLVKDKKIKGVSWVPQAFFTIWAAWNIYFYTSLDQWWSFLGGFMMLITIIIWLGLVIFYRWKDWKMRNYIVKNLL